MGLLGRGMGRLSLLGGIDDGLGLRIGGRVMEREGLVVEKVALYWC